MASRYEAWPEEYAQRLVAPEEAARLIKAGDAISMPTGALVPTVTAAIFARADELSDVDVYACAPVTDPGWWDPGHPAFRMHVEVFGTPASRSAVARRHADFTSFAFATQFKSGDERGEPVHDPDVALIAVSPPTI